MQSTLHRSILCRCHPWSTICDLQCHPWSSIPKARNVKQSIKKICISQRVFKTCSILLNMRHAISILNNRFFYQVVLVIPYRDRAEHLSKFLEIMHPFLQHQVCSLALSNCLLFSLESIKENNFLSFEVIILQEIKGEVFSHWIGRSNFIQWYPWGIQWKVK